MARFDVYPAPEGGYWLDCQSNLLSDLNSRFIVPLRLYADMPGGDRRLNPVFAIHGTEYVMQTHLAAAISAKLLSKPTTSLIEHEYRIGSAIDMLTGSY
jgi:toxin CcdB